MRLRVLHDALAELLPRFAPDEAAVEETYVNRNGSATLKLGYARGVALLAPALAGIPVLEYGAKSVKLAVVGTGGARRRRWRRWSGGCCQARCWPGRCGGCAGGGDLPRASPREPGGMGSGGGAMA